MRIMNIVRGFLTAMGGLAICVPAFAQGQGEVDAATIARGESVYTYWCATCHAEGPGMPGTQALQAKYRGDRPAVLTERTDLTPEIISAFVRNGVSVMPPFRKTEVTDDDLDALSEYVISRSRTD